VKQLFSVNGTTWHKATKSPKKEHLAKFINSKLVPQTQLQMEHFTIKDASRLFLQVTSGGVLGVIIDTKTVTVMEKSRLRRK